MKPYEEKMTQSSFHIIGRKSDLWQTAALCTFFSRQCGSTHDANSTMARMAAGGIYNTT
jgi:hypothetical protein